MVRSQKYNIQARDVFNILDYPEIANELRVLAKRILYLPDYFKTEIIISFLKEHKVSMDWIHANSVLVALITSRSLHISNTEYLFESSRDNRVFQADFENHISGQIGKAAVAESMTRMRHSNQ